MLEQMVEMRSWKVAQGLIENGKCQVCHGEDETVEHLAAECTVLSNSEYLTRKNRVLMILGVTWGKEHRLIGADTVWYKKRWEQGIVLENDKAKLVWDFQFNLWKTETTRRPDLILETKFEKQIWICDMACPMQQNIDMKRRDKLTQYRHHAFEMRERRPGYPVTIVSIIFKALGGGMKKTMNELTKLLMKQELVVKTAAEMKKTILMDKETLLRKVFSELVQSDTEENRPFS